MYDFTRKNVNYRYKPYVQSCYFDRKLLNSKQIFMKVMDGSIILKPRPARRVDLADPGLEPSRVDEKTGQGFGPVKPGRSDGSTRGNPTETRLYRVGLMKKPVRNLAR
jgi:hypothetical protein